VNTRSFLFNIMERSCFCRMKIQHKSKNIVGKNPEEIFKVLLLMASLYNFEIDYANWEKVYRLHGFLVDIYGEEYPIEKIMTEVR
jgi:hypothetical protein